MSQGYVGGVGSPFVKLVQVTRPLAPTSFLILILLLIPSLLMVWRFEDMPQFGELHDDSIYYVSAKTLASGEGYKLADLPGEPPETKFPPLYPLILSAAWKIDPAFPHNLRTAGWISWLAFPAVLALLMMYYPRMGFSGAFTWLMLAVLAINPFLLVFSSRLISEIWFTAFLLLSLVLTEEDGGLGSAVVAGVIGGLAYLTRSAGIVLLASGPPFYWLRGKRRYALAYVAAMLPFVIGWTLWSRANMLGTTDPDLIYYINYIAGYFNNISLSTLPLFMWKNLDGLLTSLGSLVLPQIFGIGFLKGVAWGMAIAMITGVVRLARKGYGVAYTYFAAGSVLLLLIWHFPPNERLVLPLFPLALAGLVYELTNFVTTMAKGLKHPQIGQRVLGAMMIGLLGLILLGSVVLQLYVGQAFLPDAATAQRKANIPNRGAYAWIRANTPADANFFAALDPLFYLYTGRHAMSRPLPPALWYHENREGVLAHYRDLVPYARAHNLSYVLVNDADFRQEMNDEDRARLEKAIRADPSLKRIWEEDTAAIYQVLPPW
jgi:hypothetical protein